jgi:ankyrin repeat protein
MFGLQRLLTALHLAAENGHDKIVQFLLQNKANVDAKDRVSDKFGLARILLSVSDT